jgi:hypothetical protein
MEVDALVYDISFNYPMPSLCAYIEAYLPFVGTCSE